MAALRTSLLPLLLLLCASPVAADPLERWRAHIAEASARFGLPVDWIRRVMRVESGGRTLLAGRPIVSPAGAMGLMQLMPGTWRAMRAKFGLGSNPHDPHDNILAGAAYLRLMYDRFGYPGMFAAYNAGPERYARFRAGGAVLPSETVAYLTAVGVAPARGSALAQPRARTSPLFALAPASAAQAAIGLPARPEVSPPGLFALRADDP